MQCHYSLKSIIPNCSNLISASSLEKRFERIFTDSDREEWQANSLAAAILMPENVFRDAAFDCKLAGHVTKGKITFMVGEDYKEFLNYLSNVFEVSRQAAEIRLEQLGHFILIMPSVFGSASNNRLFLQHGQATCISSFMIPPSYHMP